MLLGLRWAIKREMPGNVVESALSRRHLHVVNQITRIIEFSVKSKYTLFVSTVYISSSIKFLYASTPVSNSKRDVASLHSEKTCDHIIGKALCWDLIFAAIKAKYRILCNYRIEVRMAQFILPPRLCSKCKCGMVLPPFLRPLCGYLLV